MFDIIKKIVKYPRLTNNYPDKALDSSLFIGSPEIDTDKCKLCGECVRHCPSGAIKINTVSNSITIDYAQCVFCVLCEEVCRSGAAKMTNKFELATKNKVTLQKGPWVIDENNIPYEPQALDALLQSKIKKTLGRSLYIREVDAGSCNGCDYEINGLNNPFNDLERLGISFVASPRHADMLLVTGTATRNMQLALLKTYAATPDPKIVVAVGACACSGGIFRDSYATNNGIDSLVPVDVYIPGCPPRPQAILYGILKALDKV
jgi:Ni,Fe-hydrogenase III small subunit/formate hydrogenlyase subunit 6/NADH:ubiquinone oxidoreductase subunit I